MLEAMTEITTQLGGIRAGIGALVVLHFIHLFKT
jgi:hypothetical protein